MKIYLGLHSNIPVISIENETMILSDIILRKEDDLLRIIITDIDQKSFSCNISQGEYLIISDIPGYCFTAFVDINSPKQYLLEMTGGYKNKEPTGAMSHLHSNKDLPCFTQIGECGSIFSQYYSFPAEWEKINIRINS